MDNAAVRSCITIVVCGVMGAWSGRYALAQSPKASSANSSQVRKLDQKEVLRLLASGEADSVRQAAEAIEKEPPKEREELVAVTERVKSALGTTKDAGAERALRLALGKLAAAGVEDAAEWSLETVEWGFESMSVSHRPTTPPEVFEAHVRALEMVPGAAKELMIGNLDVAINFPGVEPMERQRLMEFVTLTAEGMRTRELAVFLDALLTGEEGLFVEMEPALEVRLIGCYQKVKAEEPINADAVVQWLEKHPRRSAEVEMAALETISLLGATKKDFAGKLAERLLMKRENAEEIGRRMLAGKIDRSLLPQFKAAVERIEKVGSSEELRRLVGELGK